MLSPSPKVSRCLLFCLVCLLGLLGTGESARADVVYAVISEISGASPGAYNFVGPAINASGTVAYAQIDSANNTAGVYSGSGGAVTTIADLNTTTSGGQNFTYFGNSGSVHINDSGTVGFTAGLNSGGEGIYTGNGGALTTITDRGAGFNLLSSGGINNSGEVSFTGFPTTGDDIGVYKGSGGSLTTIATYNDQAPGAFDSFGSLPDINDSGTVVFDANGATGVYTGDGGATTKIIGTSSGSFTQFVLPGINNSGTTAFTAVTGTGDTAIYTSADLTNPTVDTSGGFSSFGITSLNNNGLVAFYANTQTGGGLYMQDGLGGFITVAQVGQTFQGSTIDSLEFGPQGFNDSGQLAFIATLSDGRQGIYRSSIVATPEPSTWAMMIIGGGMCLFWTRKRRREPIPIGESEA